MLSSLKIENIAIIQSAEIAFSDGLNVLSGETGAGKSIIIDSLNLVLGERSSKELIRTGTQEARVTALFEDISPDAEQMLQRMDLDISDDHSLMISRTMKRDGRSSCRINGNPATAAMLKKLGRLLISIHGQHDSQNLLNRDYHYRYLDLLGGLTPLHRDYYSKYSEYLGLYRQYRSLQKDAEEAARRIDFLQFEVEEIESAQIRSGEWDELQTRRDFYRHSEKVIRSLEKALGDLNDGEESAGAVSSLFDASQSLEQAVPYFPEAQDTAESMTETAYAVQDLRDAVQDLLYSCNYDPQDQAAVEDRMAELQKLRSKYGQTEEEILSYLEREKKELYSLQHRKETSAELEKELEEKKGTLLEAAEKLSLARKHTAREFEQKVGEELKFLNMPNVVLQTSFTHCKLNPVGSDEIEFLISTNAGEEPKPLSKVASGGELSRIMLAIQNVLSVKGNVQTMIFDEIDTGVSGKEAERIAMKLHSVAQNHQVLCITHSAQVASYADAHYRISKEVQDGKTFTRVRKLDREGRILELARIIGGENITELQRKSAEEMLQSASSIDFKQGKS